MPSDDYTARAKKKARELFGNARPSTNGKSEADEPAAPMDTQPPDPTPATPAEETFPAPPGSGAYHGLAGEIVRAIEPQSEADPVAMLIQLLVAVGNVIGRTAHFRVEGTHHYLNLFAVCVGETSKARKGTSWSRIIRLIETVDEAWFENRIMSGLSSGQGVIWHCRDPITATEKVKERGRVTGTQQYEADPGEPDKRLLVVESEFASVLKMMEQSASTLSATLRQSWESGNLRIMNKNSPCKATGAHVSVIGHITRDELTRYLSSTEAASGFGNRFLWLAVRRSKCLPEGGGAINLDPFADRLVQAIAGAKEAGELRRDREAREIWHSVYPTLSEGKPGLAGVLLARGEAQVMRLAALYALLDVSPVIRAEHLLAALALWDYCERSTVYIFGDSLGDDVADEILRLLRGCPGGMTRTDITNYFQRNQSANRIGKALGLLLQHQLARREEEETGGRRAERWFASRKQGA